ncbi:(S)-benzoin forming benzil reductase [Paenibacillus wynnii]|uniref:Short-chain dehydrogenase n=1 Tax=Paenibacillus wynnii TaxID=268407 RepID=A0A098M2X6_9BACL|nr:(S)-benzoin forming benzil reductase [Paenibacillus wynnii]KGE16825.1 short-chain dehydrogenase [Paenibacillus wynnii]
MKYFIITGTSRGLGEAISRKLLSKGNQLYCISRNENAGLIEASRESGTNLEYINFDLLDVSNIEEMMKKIFQKIDNDVVESIILINNAGTVTPIKPIEYCSSKEIAENVQLNLIAPMILTSCFISLTSPMNTDKRIINISSGAGKKPYFGWSNYCSAKAGLDLFTRCVGLEQEEKSSPVKVISFAPGIIDTEMQEEIRATKIEDFKDLERFVTFKEEGKLLSPDQVAECVLLLLEQKYAGGELLDIKELL